MWRARRDPRSSDGRPAMKRTDGRERGSEGRERMLGSRWPWCAAAHMPSSTATAKRTSHPEPKPSFASPGCPGAAGSPAEVFRCHSRPSPATTGWPPGMMCSSWGAVCVALAWRAFEIWSSPVIVIRLSSSADASASSGSITASLSTSGGGSSTGASRSGSHPNFSGGAAVSACESASPPPSRESRMEAGGTP
eukprot:scaffold5382_cov114-Isochrysis_galbana.AAC.6